MGAVLQIERISTRVWKEHARVLESLSHANVEAAVRQMEAVCTENPIRID